MSGFQHHDKLLGATFRGLAQTRAEWTLIDLGAFPALIEGSGVVRGELYEVDSTLLERLDRLEGVPDLYQRQACDLEGGVRALVYVLGPKARPDDACVISSGCWRTRCGPTE